jgi:hypothetical protein
VGTSQELQVVFVVSRNVFADVQFPGVVRVDLVVIEIPALLVLLADSLKKHGQQNPLWDIAETHDNADVPAADVFLGERLPIILDLQVGTRVAATVIGHTIDFTF